MAANRYFPTAILLISLMLAGCSKAAKAPSPENQPPASQTSANPAALGNNGANQAPATSANRSASTGTQAAPNPAPRAISHSSRDIDYRLQQGLSRLQRCQVSASTLWLTNASGVRARLWRNTRSLAFLDYYTALVRDAEKHH
jgi:hypothetical protein